jgi:hypothetical protein
MAERVLDNAPRLAMAVADALWEDFHGRGPGSDTWWHGQAAAIDRRLVDEGLPSLGEPADLFAVVRAYRIAVDRTNPFAPPTPPAAEITFWAAFEEEHGLGVLTDGLQVLGLGVAGEVERFVTR